MRTQQVRIYNMVVTETFECPIYVTLERADRRRGRIRVQLRWDYYDLANYP